MNSLKDLWDIMSHNNICKMGVPERGEKGAERIPDEIMAENFQGLSKISKLHTKETQ